LLEKNHDSAKLTLYHYCPKANGGYGHICLNYSATFFMLLLQKRKANKICLLMLIHPTVQCAEQGKDDEVIANCNVQ
jgi:hypothetical protein